MKNLKKLLLLIVFAISATVLFSQVTYGLRVGAAFPDVRYEDYDGTDISFDPYIGISATLVAEISLSDYFSIQPEIAFVQKGMMTKYDSYSGEGTIKDQMRMNYVEVPILVKLEFDADKYHTYLAAGPAFGYAMNGFYKYDGDKEDFTDEDWDYFNRFEVGANMGVGFGVDAGTGVLYLDTRFMTSLNNLYVEDEFDEDIKLVNQGFIVSLGYMF